ncbi:MAG TPA: 16S rRNA (cytidine(1402)-2'-O)-methyltransferase [Streptosporangiaceae bacterium]|nr:16S rRNA (cytidine(1402)-2'-O)-methyltransferase [Streptosporangiaceae bacterium]
MNRASAGPAGNGPASTGPDISGPAGYVGVLTVAAAPIGDPADASARLGPALAGAGLIAAEDTRRLRRLAAALGVRLAGRVVSYYDDVEARRVPGLLAELAAGQDVLLVTDAGLPGVSDPGYRLIAAAAQAGIRVTVLPGPSAVTTALVVSGLPGDRFAFEGFPSRRSGERERRFAELAAERRTLIFFESPRRVGQTLAELAAAFGTDRRAAVCRELTKTHEEVLRGTLGELASRLSDGTLGEVTLVVAGAPAAADGPAALAEAVAQVQAHVQDGATTRDAVATVATATGLRRRDLYNAATAAAAVDQL